MNESIVAIFTKRPISDIKNIKINNVPIANMMIQIL